MRKELKANPESKVISLSRSGATHYVGTIARAPDIRAKHDKYMSKTYPLRGHYCLRS